MAKAIGLKEWQYAQQLKEGILSGKIPFDYGEHFRRDLKDINRYLLYIHFDTVPSRGKFVPIPPSCLFTCYECGEELQLETNGKEVRCLNPCKYPDGYPPVEFELNVPSGKMVVANDLRDGFRVIGDYYINHTINIAKTTLKYADVGLAHAFVGNTCPGVYRRNNHTFTIGAGGRGFRHISGVCTDLWWYSICDYDEFVRRYNREPIIAHEDVVICKPGVYRFKHVYHTLDHNKRNQVYTYIDWAREPDPVRDFKMEFNALNLTAGQVLLDLISEYPDVYGKNRKHALMVAASSAESAGGEEGRAAATMNISLAVEVRL